MSALPASSEAERSVLGIILLRAESSLDEALAALRVEDFSLDSHRRIFRALGEMAERSEHIDSVTLRQKLQDSRELEAIGGYSYLSSLTENLGSSLKASIRLVREKSLLRYLIEAAQHAITQAQSGETAEACYTALESALLDAREANLKKSWRALKEVMPEAINELATLWQRPPDSGPLGYSTGIAGLDFETTGIRYGNLSELWIIGARPGQGKTALMTQIAHAVASKGKRVALFSAEMSELSIAMRMLAQNAGLPARNIRDPRYLVSVERNLVIETAGEMSKLPIWIDDTPSPSLRELRAKANLAVRKYGVELIALDYIQLVQVPRANGEHAERLKIMEVAFRLRDLARSLKVPIIALSQLKRAEDLNRRPVMADLMESSALEQAAQVIILPYQPIDEHSQRTGMDELIIAKQREGKPGAVNVRFDKDSLRFVERR